MTAAEASRRLRIALVLNRFWPEVGGAETNVYFQAVDMRLKARGYKILCLEDVYIHHWGSASFARLGQTEYWKLFQQNLQQFEEKWDLHWQPHPHRLEFVPEQLRQLVDGMVELSAKVADYSQKLTALQELVDERYRAIVEKDRIIAETWAKFKERDTLLLHSIWRLSLLLVPHGSTRERLLNWIMRPLRAWRRYGSFGLLRIILTRLGTTRPVKAVGRLVNPLLPGSWKEFLSNLRQESPNYDRSQVYLFTDDENLQPNYPNRCPLLSANTTRQVQVSLIATVRENAAGADRAFQYHQDGRSVNDFADDSGSSADFAGLRLPGNPIAGGI